LALILSHLILLLITLKIPQIFLSILVVATQRNITIQEIRCPPRLLLKENMELVETMVLMQFHKGVVLAEAVTQLPVVLVFVVELEAL
jgi:hypothetical protein